MPDALSVDNLLTAIQKEWRVYEDTPKHYRLFSPFAFDDGDRFVMILRPGQHAWELSDEGHTFMHLSYKMDEGDLKRGTRQTLIHNTLSLFSIEDRDGELVMPLDDARDGERVFHFAQALCKLSDLAFLSREQVRSTFLEDFRTFFREHLPPEHLAFDWHDAQRDPLSNYIVDCRVASSPDPTWVFALPTDDRVKDATITIHQLRHWGLKGQTLAVFENQEAVHRKALSRLTDVCEYQVSSLSSNAERILTLIGA